LIPTEAGLIKISKIAQEGHEIDFRANLICFKEIKIPGYSNSPNEV
jgi:hypothetical protein